MNDWLIWGMVGLCLLMVWVWGAWGWRSHGRTLDLLIRSYIDNQALRNTALALARLVPPEKQDQACALLDAVLGPAEPDEANVVK